MSKCCICGREFEGMGNNPEPVFSNDGGNRCCNHCDDVVVLPVRIFIAEKIREVTSK